MKQTVAALIAAILIVMCGSVPLAEEEGVYGDFDTESVIAAVKPSLLRAFGADDCNSLESLGVSKAESLRLDSGISVFGINSEPDILKLTLSEPGRENVLELINTLNEREDILFAEPNYIFTVDASVNDPYYNNDAYSYALDKVNASEVWDMDVDCSDITVAVIDTGVLMTHEDLTENIWINPYERDNGYDDDENGYADDINGWDFMDGDNDPTDELGHGTHVAGIASAATDNNKGLASLARSARIMPLRVFDADGNTTLDTVIQAFEYAKSMDVDIVNCSFGGVGGTAVQTLALLVSECPDTLFVAAAGNVDVNFPTANNDKKAVYPSSLSLTQDNVISVANSTSGDKIASSSHYGQSSVNIAAPGTDIISTYYTGNSSYATMSGTSMAAPLVSSAAAVVKAVNPDLTGARIREILTDTVYTASAYSNKVSSGGRLDAYAAAQAAYALLPASESTPTPEPTPTSIFDGYNYIEFIPGAESNTVQAELIIPDNTPLAEDITAYAAFKEDGVLKEIHKLQITDGLTAEIIIPEEYAYRGVTVYVWDKYQRAYMDPQTYTPEGDDDTAA